MLCYAESETFRCPKTLNATELKSIKGYVSKTIRSWIKNCEVFTVKDLFGYENWNWSDTPLQILYDKRYEMYYDENVAYRQAAIDLGHIVKMTVRDMMPEKFTIERIGNWNIQYSLIK